MTRRLALVTGASSGIGAAFARIYASHGYDVAIAARRTDRLEALAEEISMRHGVETLILTADLSDPAAGEAMLADIESHGRVVDALVNNAGYGLPGAYAATAWADQQALLQVLLNSVCELTHKVLPGMLERRFGRIVNVASVAGLLPGTPGATLYGPAKAFLINFSQSLCLETQGSGVHVNALCPGYTYSEFHDVNGARERLAANTPPWLWMGADEVAATGYEAAEAGRPVCVTGVPNKAIALACQMLPDEWVMALMRTRLGQLRGL